MAETPRLDDLDVSPDADVRHGAPQQQHTVIGGERSDRQAHDLIEWARAVMVVDMRSESCRLVPHVSQGQGGSA